jgi:hypothetical protein
VEAAWYLVSGNAEISEGDLMNINPIYVDSFDGYDTTTTYRWPAPAGAATITNTVSRTGGQSMKCTLNAFAQRPVPDLSSFYCGFALAISDGFPAGTQVFGTWDGQPWQTPSAWQLGLRINADGTLVLGTGESNGQFATVLATSASKYDGVGWHYIEVHGVISPTAGVAEVRVDGTVWASVSGVNTSPIGSSKIAGYWLGCLEQGGATVYFDDHYFLDGNGSPPNTYLGNCQVIWGSPSGPGSYAQWTPVGSSQNYQNVNEVHPNEDYNYNTSATPGQIDSFVFPALPSTVQSVVAAVVVARVRSDNGSPTIHLVTKSGAVIGESGDISVPANSLYAPVIAPFAINPATGSAWTPSQLSAAEIGYKEIS